MAGPGQPVTHDAPHDLESLFYILVGICVLLDAPFKFKSNDKLSHCFDKYFNTFEPSVLKSIIIQSDLTWFLMIVDHISSYFEPLLPLLTRLHQDIISLMYTTKDERFYCAKPLTHDVLIGAIIDALLNLNDGTWAPYNNQDSGGKHCTGHSGTKVDEESRHRDDQDLEEGGDIDEDDDADEDREDESGQEMLSPADKMSASPLTQSIISDSESDHIGSWHSKTPAHWCIFQPITASPPDLIPSGFGS